MANIIQITDFDAPELDVYARLTQSQLRSRRHPEQALFIAESANVIERALRAGYTPVSLLMDEKHIHGKASELIACCGDVNVYTATPAVLEQLTGFALTRGVLCAMRPLPLPTLEGVCAGGKRIAVIDNVLDAANVGSIFRNAAALHIDAVLVTDSSCDPLNRRCVRVSMGTVFQVPWTVVSGKTYLSALQSLGIQTMAMALDARALDMDDPILQAQERLAIVLGTEGYGLPEETVNQCDYTACIPMSHDVDSLNVAAASAVAFWQLRPKG
ncbi:RNA methyltransferase [Bengtsoniella intestinalis]|uniref:TrmH family RNA methyltransferase n=1 Tax=Bengtsoniella intestinalis TaxID=3073143 RepID=UPI00391EEF80